VVQGFKIICNRLWLGKKRKKESGICVVGINFANIFLAYDGGAMFRII
jgi:hypothetical protein